MGITAGAESIVGSECFYAKSKKMRVLGFSAVGQLARRSRGPSGGRDSASRTDFIDFHARISLVFTLFRTGSIEEVEPLVLRYREAAKAHSEKEGCCFAELNSLLFSAQLHEVLCLCTPCWEPHTTAQ